MQIGFTLVPEFERLYNEFASSSNGLKLLDIEGISPKHLDVGIQSHEFFENKLSDISTDSNSNFCDNMNPTVYGAFTTNGQMKLLGYHMMWYYAMKRYGIDFANEAMQMIWDGSLYLHDAHGKKIQMPYCFAFSVDKLVFEGRMYGSSPNTPPKHRKSFISQIDKLISDLSKQFAGATAPSDFFLWYAYFCKKECILDLDLDKDTIIQDLQGLVCLFNEPNRAEGEPPFTNIALYDRVGLQSLFGHIVYPDFTKPDLDYIMKLQRIFAEWFSNGDPITGFPYRFPVVTMNLTTDSNGDFADYETSVWAAKTNLKMGNFNEHFGDKSKIAMCCRYENDLDDMNLTPDSFGNGGVNIGSHRVITPSSTRAALLSDGDIDKFYKIYGHYIDVASKLLYVHRKDILGKRIEKTPEYLEFFGKLGWFNLDTMFSTIGITAVYETVSIMGYNITDDDGTEFALDMLAFVKRKIKEARKTYGYVYNAEEIPGEQACVTLTKKDKIMIPDANKILDGCELYSNQYIPLVSNTDVLTRIELSGRFMEMVGGGGIVHANFEYKIDTWEKMHELMKFAAKSGVKHMAVCYRFGKCADHPATIIGQGAKVCPVCGKPIVHVRARVIGYYSDEYDWHPVRKEFDAPNRHYTDCHELEELEEK